MNLYAYAGNNPVAFSDPFGLCRPWPECYLQNAADWGARRGGIVGSLVLNGAAALNGGAEATGLNDLGRAIADGSAVSTGTAVAGMLPAGKLGKLGGLGPVHSFLENPGAWKKVGSFVEAAKNRRARGGASIQTIYENADGARVVEHTVVDRAGKAIDGPHPRPQYKPRDGELD